MTPQIIIEQALALLASRPMEAFTLGEVAQALGTATMSLYKYFANRDALLDAVADYSFSMFEMPKAQTTWQETLLAWLWAMQRHMDRYPVAMKVSGWDGHIPPALLRVNAPVIEMFRKLGLHDSDLAFALDWFMSSAMGLVIVEAVAPRFRLQPALTHLDTLPPDVQSTYLALMPFRQTVDRDKLLDFGFRHLITGVEMLLSRADGRRRRPSC